MVTDDELIALAKTVLQDHFGLYRMQRSLCATCDVPWPCPPVKLAQAAQEQALAR